MKKDLSRAQALLARLGSGATSLGAQAPVAGTGPGVGPENRVEATGRDEVRDIGHTAEIRSGIRKRRCVGAQRYVRAPRRVEG